MDADTEKLIVEALEGTGYEVIAEAGGWSLYDRRLALGEQMLANVQNILGLLDVVLYYCKFTRKQSSERAILDGLFLQ